MFTKINGYNSRVRVFAFEVHRSRCPFVVTGARLSRSGNISVWVALLWRFIQLPIIGNGCKYHKRRCTEAYTLCSGYVLLASYLWDVM